MKEKKNIKRQGNLVLFPGAIERMVEQAQGLAENYHYAQANKLFEEALQYTEGDEMSLSVYAYSLYEAKDFGRAKEICEDLLALGPVMYFEAMELYLTICMQLRQFRQVEKIIESLFDEGAIPQDQVEKFERLKNLNAEIAENQRLQVEVDEAPVEEPLEFDAPHFLEKSLSEQMMIVHDLASQNIRPIVDELKKIIEYEETNLFIQSLIVILLVEQQVVMDVVIKKFDREITVNPATLELPTKLPQFQEVSAILLEKLEQEPSILELAQYLIAKHAIVTYPFEWLDYASDDVVQSYIDFVRVMFGEVQEMDYELVEFLQQLEKIAEL